MSGRVVLGFVLGVLFSGYCFSNSLYVPEPLSPWVEWVKQEDPEHQCPFYHTSFQHKACGWPGKLSLQANAEGVGFQQSWQVFSDSWVPLPGGEGFWPQQVWVNEEAALVVERKSKPYLRLKSGSYLIEGIVPWEFVPEYINVPLVTGLLDLQVNDVMVATPHLDTSGRLWLTHKQADIALENQESDLEDKLSIRVYRHLIDDIPFQINTYIELEVSGNSREMLLGKVLFDDYQVRQFNSPLPARLDEQGRLRVQLRAGQWKMQINAHHTKPVTKVFLENVEEAIWPEEEVWVFQSKPELRQIRIDGPESIDPNQTSLPHNLRQWPTYPMKLGQALSIAELRRGDPQPSPNQLTNHRVFWLDFDGAGMTVQDTLAGTLYRDWRLNVSSDVQLGKLELNGQAQVITLVNDQMGVEVRNGQLQAKALSRIPLTDLNSSYGNHAITIQSAGWLQDFDGLSSTLHLPVGWRVLLAKGADSASNTWVASWSVWDVFIVMITIAAVWKLRGILAALISGLALILIYPEAPSFLFLLLNVVAITSLLSLLPEGRLQKISRVYAVGASLILILWLVNFMVDQARFGLYPQLEQPRVQMGSAKSMDNQYSVPVAAAPATQRSLAMEDAVMESDVMEERLVKPKPKSKLSSKSLYSYGQKDPNRAAQTGPGLPNWHWRSSTLRWSGPVTQQEQFTIWLLNPLENRILCWLRVLLSALLVFSVLGLCRIGGKWTIQLVRSKPVGIICGALLMGGGLGLSPNSAFAEMPDSELLQQLKQRIQDQENCAPHCLSITTLQVNHHTDRLTLRFSVNALKQVYWVLPDSQGQWQIDAVLLGGEPHYMRKVTKREKSQIFVPAGQHDITVTGTVRSDKEFQLNFTVLPHNITFKVDGMQVKGVENGRLLSNSMGFYPEKNTVSVQPDKPELLAPNPISGFVKVEREIRLGLNWYMETRVKRLAPHNGSIHMEIPLLPGESVTSQAVDIENGVAHVSLQNGVNEMVWFSSLEKTSLLKLQASDTSHWSEHWIVEPSPLWNIEVDGIAPIKKAHTEKQWRPQWRPYPGEQVTLHIARPKAVVGETKTIDQIHQTWKPGRRESQSNLRIHLNSSKGTEQRINLPLDARVRHVKVNDQLRAVDESNPNLVVSLNPGEHWVEVSWAQPEGLKTKARSPLVAIDETYVNHNLTVEVPRDRWVLFVGGPAMGPAILFWGLLSVMIVVGVALGRIPSLQLKSWHWVLLIIGLSAGWIEAIIPVAIWFYVMDKRNSNWADKLNRVQFNFMQVILVLFSVFTFSLLLGAIPNGLLGSPDMGITGNGSSMYNLNWFVDRGQDQLQSAWFVSLPMWVYRSIMLLWSLWLSVFLLRWLKWGWQCYTKDGYWRSAKSIEVE